MEDIGHGESARQLSVNVDVVAVQHILNSDFRGDCLSPLIDRKGGGVTVSVNETGGHMPAPGIDDDRIIDTA